VTGNQLKLTMIFLFHGCELDTQRITLCRGDQTIRPRPKVLQMLTYLLKHRDRVVPKDELYEQVWLGQFISDATLESTIRAVRQAVGDSGRRQRLIETVHGHGYRFVAAVEARPEAPTGEVATEAGPAASELSATPTRVTDKAASQAIILVVDDEINIIRRMEALLLPRDYKVISAVNGAEALQQVQQERPDLILLDVMMPVMDGFEVCRRLKDDVETRLIPVVLMTALGDVEDRIKGLEAGADDFLTKPVHRDELLARIRTSLRLKQTIDHKVDTLQHARDHPAAPLFLTILRQGDTITVDLTEVDLVVPRGQMQIEENLLSDIDEELARLTTTSIEATSGQPDNTHLPLQRLGSLIFSHLFPASARQGLIDAAPTDLFLRLDDQLVHLPWELAFDGQDFLLNKFRIGRQVIAHQPSAVRNPRDVRDARGFNMLIVVDPTESLPAATEEAEELRNLLDGCQNLEVSVIGGKQLRKIDLLRANFQRGKPILKLLSHSASPAGCMDRR
jgi:DNA-binding response OmpR family regulator